jgi:hypothetical protein
MTGRSVVIWFANRHRWRRRREKVEQPLDANRRLIPLTRGQVASVDATDYERLMQFRWMAVPSGPSGYRAVRRERGRFVRMESAILSLRKGERVTFRNGDRLDLRKANLVTASLKMASFLSGSQKGMR